MRLNSEADIAEVITTWGPQAGTEWNRLSMFEAYYVGLHRPPYQPDTATREFRTLVQRSVTNLTRLIVHTMTQRLVVDGFRPSSSSVENAPQWKWWQANGLDARQKALYDEAAKAGYAGCMVLPGEKDGEPTPVMRPVSAREWWVGFEDFSDDWPFLALKNGDRKEGEPTTKDYQVWHVLDDHARYVVKYASNKSVTVTEVTVHGLGVVPIVPFRNGWNLTRYPEGEIEPVIAIQDRLNQTVFDLLVAQTYAASPQKYATGLVLPTDDTGNPLVDLRAFAKSLWATSDPEAKFGSLPEANLKNIVEAIEQCLRVYGLTSQTPPHYLLGDLVNLPLALDTVVPTPTGLSTVGGLGAGDQVLAPDGQTINVIGKTPVFLGHDCYRLRFDDGTEVVADARHRWVTTHFTSWNAPYRHHRETSSVTTEQIARTLHTKMGTATHYIDVAEPFDGPEQDFDIPPYVLGVWLGDGDRVNGLITSHVDDADELVGLLRAEGETVMVRPYSAGDETHRDCRLVTVSYDHERCPRGHVRARGTRTDYARCPPCAALRYREMRYGEPLPSAPNVSFKARLKRNGLWKNKHIPEAYFHGSLKQRLALLAGIMDTDGSVAGGGTLAITLHDEGLAHDVCRLIRSAGMKVALRETTAQNFDKTGTVTAWRMSWSGTVPVFRLARKAGRQRIDFGGGDGKSNVPHRHYIVACDPIPSVPVQCVTVDSADHLFLVTDAGICTGNSAEALLAADTTLAKKVQDHQVLFGEAWEQTFRLAGVAAGDKNAATDTEAQVWWRDTEPRSIAQQVDAMGKLVQMLGVPQEALWEKVPGTTGADLQLWRTEAARQRLRAARQGAQNVTGTVNAAERTAPVGASVEATAERASRAV